MPMGNLSAGVQYIRVGRKEADMGCSHGATTSQTFDIWEATNKPGWTMRTRQPVV